MGSTMVSTQVDCAMVSNEPSQNKIGLCLRSFSLSALSPKAILL